MIERNEPRYLFGCCHDYTRGGVMYGVSTRSLSLQRYKLRFTVQENPGVKHAKATTAEQRPA